MIQTTLCYIERESSYLMLHRVKKKNDVNHDKWIGVGGKFEKNEAPEECLLREVKEETGLRLTGYRYRGMLTFIYNDKDPEYIFTYTADSFEGDLDEAGLKGCDEGELCWVEKKRIPELSLWKGDRIMFRLLAAEREAPFSLKLCYNGDELVEWKELSGAYRDILETM
ncbi:MAG: 8-oxo-dGTP diphosphatase [Eubacteriales bacterium]|nr:8-oxo-dGTP diphosphatase [Eubacteriales bacterium]